MKTPIDRKIFLSYRTRRYLELAPLIDAIHRAGITVWRDESSVESGTSISLGIRAGLASSHALIAFYSADYGESRICQWELATAWMAGTVEGDPFKRVFVIAKRSQVDSIHLGAARDSKWFDWPDELDEATCDAIAQEIRRRIATLCSTIGELVRSQDSVKWFPNTKIGSARFVGRSKEMWRLHAKLHDRECVAFSGSNRQSVVQLRGLGGMGKTLLAIEYATRFQAAYPGGIFWFDRDTESIEDFLCRLAPQLGIESKDRSVVDLANSVRRKLLGCGAYLWILDDPNPDLSQPQLEQLVAPTPNGHTILTTRSTSWAAFGMCIDLAPLEQEASLQLILGWRPIPNTPSERWRSELQAAQTICDELGNHPLALDLIGALLVKCPSHTPFTSWRTRLADRNSDDLELSAFLNLQLPTGCASSVAVVLHDNISGIGNEGRDVLLILLALGNDPIPQNLVVMTLEFAVGTTSAKAEDLTMLGLDQLASSSLIVTEDLEIRIHPIVKRASIHILRSHSRYGVIHDALLRAINKKLDGAGDPSSYEELHGIVPHVRYITSDFDRPAKFEAARKLIHFESARARELVRRPTVVLTGRNFLPIHDFDDPETIDADEMVKRTDYVAAFLSTPRETCERAVARAIELNGENDAETLSWRHDLAAIQFEQGDLVPAVENVGRAFVGRQSRFGLLDVGLIQSSLLMGKIYLRAGLYREALMILPTAYLAVCHVPTFDDAERISVGLDLSKAWILAGQSEKAVLHLDNILQIVVSKLGPLSISTLRVLHYFSIARLYGGQPTVAKSLLMRELDKRTSTLGSVHPSVLVVLNSLEHVCRILGEDDESARYEDRLLSMELGKGNPLVPYQQYMGMKSRADEHEKRGRGDRARRLRKMMEETSQSLFSRLSTLNPPVVGDPGSAIVVGDLDGDPDLRHIINFIMNNTSRK